MDDWLSALLARNVPNRASFARARLLAMACDPQVAAGADNAFVRGKAAFERAAFSDASSEILLAAFLHALPGGAGMFCPKGGPAGNAAWRMLVDAGAGPLLARRVALLVDHLRLPCSLAQFPRGRRNQALEDSILRGTDLRDVLALHALVFPAEGRKRDALAAQARHFAGLRGWNPLAGEPPPDADRKRILMGEGVLRPVDRPRGTLHILHGMPGAGKTTWSQRQGWPVISMDDLRLRDRAYRRTPEHDLRMRRLALGMLDEHLRRGTPDLVWDNTSLSARSREVTVKAACQQGYRVTVLSFDQPFSVALARCRSRGRPMAERDILRMASCREMVRAHEAHAVASLRDLEATPVCGDLPAMDMGLATPACRDEVSLSPALSIPEDALLSP